MKRTIFTSTSIWLIFAGMLLSMSGAYAQIKYYIAANGDDAASGTQEDKPWKTLSKLKSLSGKSNFKILLKRGDTFFGSIRIQGSNISVEAYGSGADPVITGQQRISGKWVKRNNVWAVKGPSKKEVNLLFENETSLPLSRYPNTSAQGSYINISDVKSPASFNIQEGGNLDWTRSGIVIRTKRFRNNRTNVLSVSGGQVNIPKMSSKHGLNKGFGVYFVNHINAIDLDREWAYDSRSKEFLLKSDVDPSNLSIAYSSIDTLISVVGSSNIEVKNLQLLGANKLAMGILNSKLVKADLLKLVHIGGDGIDISGSSDILISNSKIYKVNNSGIISDPKSIKITIRGNDLQDIGNESFGRTKTFVGIDCNSGNSTVYQNVLKRIGYSGIISAGTNNRISRNVVDSAGMILDDLAGIYLNANINSTKGTRVDSNVVLNTLGNLKGTPAKSSLGNGIYLDNNSGGVFLKNNTIAFVKGIGLLFHNTTGGNEIIGNTVFNSGVNELGIVEHKSAPRLKILKNVLISTSNTAGKASILAKTVKFELNEIGTFTDNYVYNPSASEVQVKHKGAQQKQTQGFSRIDAKSGSATSAEPKLFYNKSGAKQSFQLPAGVFIDVLKTEYSGQLTLSPFSSVILFPKP